MTKRQDSNQTVHGAANGQPSLSQVAVNVGAIDMIGEAGIDPGQNEQIFSNSAALGILPDTLEDFLHDHSRRKNMIAAVEAVL
jgi:hypothetical protein